MIKIASSFAGARRASSRGGLACGLILAMFPFGETALAAETPAPTVAVMAAPALWRMPGAAASMRLSGEDSSITWPLYVPAGSLARLTRFQLGYQAAISVMPEASSLALTINGHAIGRAPIAAPTSARLLSFDIPAGTLSAGWNAVQVSLVQRHRVDCSMDATYELWTQIDPARTGFVGGPPAIATLDDLQAAPADAAGAERIRLSLPVDATPADIERTLAFAERVALRGRFAHPVFDASAASAALRIALAPAPGVNGAAATPALQLVAVADGVTTPIASGEGDLDKIFGAVSREPKGAPEGLRALANASGRRLLPGESLSLAELGVGTHAFTGRLFRAGFDLVLPPDSYIADYGEALFSFDGGYAAGLTNKARLLIRVNGVIDGRFALDRAGGAALQGEVIHMSLESFHPGRNHVEIEAQLHAPADEACEPLAVINAEERFLILGTSAISIPNLARIARFPSLAATFSDGFRVTGEAPARLYLPHPTPGAIAAAATLLANVALHTGAPTDVSVRRGQPSGEGGAAIVLAAAADLPSPLLATVGIDPASMTDLWGTGLRPGETPTASEAPGRDERNDSDHQRLDAWGERIGDPNGWYGSAIAGAERSLRAAGLIGSADPPYSVTPDTSFVVAQGMLGDTALTVFTAPDEPALTKGAAGITDPSQLARVDGRVAALDASGGGLDLVAAREPTFFWTQSYGLGNDRLVAAGWLSNHAGWYIGAALLIVILLGASTWACLTYSRRRA
jgi:hypothetical protein